MTGKGPELGGSSDPNEMMQWQRMLLGGGMYAGETSKNREALMHLDDEVAVKQAIDVFVGAAIGMPVKESGFLLESGGGAVVIDSKGYLAWPTLGEAVLDEQGKDTGRRVEMMINEDELMQRFMSPDWLADRKPGGYRAMSILEGLLVGEGREDMRAVMQSPESRYTKEEAVGLAEKAIVSGQYTEDMKDRLIASITGRYKESAVKRDRVMKVLREEAARYNGLMTFMTAFQIYEQSCGDEKSGAEGFIEPRPKPQGPDFKAMLEDVETLADGTLFSPRDQALRGIVATGMTYDQLERDGKLQWTIKGIHYVAGEDDLLTEGEKKLRKKNKLKEVTVKGEKYIVVDRNPYAEGWDSNSFRAWLGKLEEVTHGDMLAVYESWLVAIGTGLVGKVAKSVNGKIGDPPLVSSFDAWTMHFTAKQMGEAGYELDRETGRWKMIRPYAYKGKTGPLIGIGGYPDEWIGSYFDMATFKVKENGGDLKTKSLFEQWWQGEGKEEGLVSRLPWVKIEEAQQLEEEVRMSGYGGWLYDKFQMYKLFAIIQGVPPLKDLAGYSTWEGISRSLDKVRRFGVAWQRVDDAVEMTEAIKRWNGGVKKAEVQGKTVNEKGPRKMVVRDINGGPDISFMQVLPDAINPKYTLLKTLLQRYAPVGALGVQAKTGDSPLSMRELFTTLSEMQERTSAIDPKILEFINPGSVPIENFINAYVRAGMLTVSQVYSAMNEVYNKSFVDKIWRGPSLASMLKNSGIV